MLLGVSYLHLLGEDRLCGFTDTALGPGFLPGREAAEKDRKTQVIDTIRGQWQACRRTGRHMPFRLLPDQYTPPEDWITAVLDTNGDGTGDTNAVGDYSSEETLFRYNATFLIEIRSLLIRIGGTGSITPSNYVTLAGPLTNGIGINVYEQDGTAIRPVNVAARVKSTIDWTIYTFHARPDDYGGGENYLSVAFDTDDIGNICMTPGRFFGVILNDDFTGLSVHTFVVHGKRIRP